MINSKLKNNKSDITFKKGVPPTLYYTKNDKLSILDIEPEPTIIWYQDGTIKKFQNETIDSALVSDNKNMIIKVSFGENVTKIGMHAFENCTNLNELIFSNAKKLTIIDSQSFYECSNLKTLNLPLTINSYRDQFQYCGFEGNVVIPNHVIFGHGFCTGWANAITITCPETMEQNGWFYRDCTSLIECNITKATTSLPALFFGNNPNLTIIHYSGTIEEWGKLSKSSGWRGNGYIGVTGISENCTVRCIDGDTVAGR